MYLAPLNYDRFFKKIFSDKWIVKQFLEDFLEVTITSIEPLALQQRITDDAAIVEFDYRCKINDAYVIIDMQQWYKPGIVQRFYLYHALNTGLQLEDIPKKRLVVDIKTRKIKRIRDYRLLEPVLTLVWMVHDTLSFKENYVAYTMAPELVLEFLENDRLWDNPNIRDLLKERHRVLAIANNHAKQLDFLKHNRLVFMFQKNIVKQQEKRQYERWFQFAEKSRNKENKSADFAKFQGDDVFEEMIRRLEKESLSEDDLSYIANEQEIWEEVAKMEQGYYEDGRYDGRWEGREIGREEGREEGRKEGREEGRRKIAQQLLDILDDQTIAKKTGLSVEEVQQLRQINNE